MSAFALVTLAASPALCADATVGELEVRLTLMSGCALSVGTAAKGGRIANGGALLDFGSASDPDHAADGTMILGNDGAIVSVACSSQHTGANAPTVSIDGGIHRHGDQRRMVGPAHAYAPYSLYRDPARNEPYDPDLPVQLVIPTAGVPVPIAIFGRVPTTPDLPDGLYTDTITLTLNY